MSRRLGLTLVALVIAVDCAAAPPSPPSSRMVPARLGPDTTVQGSLHVLDVKLASAARTRETPFESVSGKFPLTERDGLVQLRQAIGTTLAAAGARLEPEPATAEFILTPIVLGAMTIPFPEAYAILFVRYELSRADGAQVWSGNVYSQARFPTRDVVGEQSGEAQATYARVAAANLRQMATSLSDWFATRAK